jgi:hypothetical protein
MKRGGAQTVPDAPTTPDVPPATADQTPPSTVTMAVIQADTIMVTDSTQTPRPARMISRGVV